MIPKPEQIDDIAICKSFDAKIFPEKSREKENVIDRMKSFITRKMAFHKRRDDDNVKCSI